MNNKSPEIKAIKTVHYECKQPKFAFMGSLPTRSILLGPSGTGKTTVMANLLLNHYVYIIVDAITLVQHWFYFLAGT